MIKVSVNMQNRHMLHGILLRLQLVVPTTHPPIIKLVKLDVVQEEMKVQHSVKELALIESVMKILIEKASAATTTMAMKKKHVVVSDPLETKARKFASVVV